MILYIPLFPHTVGKRDLIHGCLFLTDERRNLFCCIFIKYMISMFQRIPSYVISMHCYLH